MRTRYSGVPLRKAKFVVFEWLDACSRVGWLRPELSRGLSTIRSAGFVVHFDRDVIVITTTWDEEGLAADPFTIPRSAITKLRGIAAPKL